MGVDDVGVLRGIRLVVLDRSSTITGKGLTATGAGPGCGRLSGQNLVERTLPCHFTDGSAAACVSRSIFGTTGSGSGRRTRIAAGERRRATRPRPRPTGGESDAPAAAGKHRSLPVLYRELYGVLKGHRRTIALALLSLSAATLLKLIPPAATKAAIDYIMLARPLPSSFQEWSPIPIPESPRLRLVVLVAVVTVITIIGTMIGLWSRWLATRTTKRVQVSVRRKVYEHAMRLPLHRVYQLKSGGASSLLREDAGGVGELVFSMLYNPWRAVVQFLGGLVVLAWVDWRLLLGVALPGAAASTIPTCSGTAASGRSSATSASSGKRSTARPPRSSAACGWSGPSAARRASRRGSWARTTS